MGRHPMARRFPMYIDSPVFSLPYDNQSLNSSRISQYTRCLLPIISTTSNHKSAPPHRLWQTANLEAIDLPYWAVIAGRAHSDISGTTANGGSSY